MRILEHVQEHLLGHVLREAARLGHREREPVDVVVAAPVELYERLLDAACNLGEQTYVDSVVRTWIGFFHARRLPQKLFAGTRQKVPGATCLGRA